MVNEFKMICRNVRAACQGINHLSILFYSNYFLKQNVQKTNDCLRYIEREISATIQWKEKNAKKPLEQKQGTSATQNWNLSWHQKKRQDCLDASRGALNVNVHRESMSDRLRRNGCCASWSWANLLSTLRVRMSYLWDEIFPTTDQYWM